jgi:hypothetical protein
MLLASWLNELLTLRKISQESRLKIVTMPSLYNLAFHVQFFMLISYRYIEIFQ